MLMGVAMCSEGILAWINCDIATFLEVSFWQQAYWMNR